MAIIETTKVGYSYREVKMNTHRLLIKMGVDEKNRKKFGRIFADAEAARLNGEDTIHRDFGRLESTFTSEDSVNGKIDITLDDRKRPTYVIVVQLCSPKMDECGMLSRINE